MELPLLFATVCVSCPAQCSAIVDDLFVESDCRNFFSNTVFKMTRAGVALSAIGEALQPDQRLRWNYCIDVAGMSPAAVKVSGTTAAQFFAAEVRANTYIW